MNVDMDNFSLVRELIISEKLIEKVLILLSIVPNNKFRFIIRRPQVLGQ